MLALLAATFTVLTSGAACATDTRPAAGAPTRSPLGPPGNAALYLSDGSVVSVVDGATGQVQRRMPAGAPSPDWKRLYSVAGSYANVQLRVVDTATGAIVHALPVPDWASEARLSANGSWLALVSKPDPRAPVTHFQVRDTELVGTPRDVQLPGAFVFDGLSGDGQRLFVLQLRPDGSYQVKLYDLAAQRLLPEAIVDKSDGSTVMSGASVHSFTTADGQEQLTLYERDARNQSFVHVLPVGTATEFAYCVDLPAPGSNWTLSPAPDGRHFYAVNMVSEAVVTLTADGLTPPQVSGGHVDAGTSRLGLVRDAEAKEAGQRTAATVSADGGTLFAGTGDRVVRIDPATLRAGAAGRLAGEEVTSLAAGRSGWLYATTAAGRLLRIDPGSMRVAWTSSPAFKGSSILRTAG
ncbi:MAG: hypothetical protein DLM67_23530 [Candidatus Nephthysia bennettiae]|nr:MAG: hypothetical protein DLM67_23530 [Candidatus Dormibacteraeota bacterium]